MPLSLTRTVVEEIAHRVALHPERDALITSEEHVSYDKLWHHIVAAADILRQYGVRQCDRVLLAAPSAPAFVYAYFASHLLGAIAVPIDPLAPLKKYNELIERTSPKIVFGMTVRRLATGEQVRDIAELSELPPRYNAYYFPNLDIDSDLLFTTGSTGRPKGVRLTHRNIATAANHINAVIHGFGGDIEILPLPLYHAFGLGRLRCGLVAGRSIVFVDGYRDPRAIFSAIEKNRATGMSGVPTNFGILLAYGAGELERFANQLRYVEIGSAPMPIEHKQALMACLPTTELWMHYGLTEAARSAFIEFHRHRDHLDTVGLPAPGVALDIRAESGTAPRSGEPGLLWVGGAHVAPGYWDDADLSEKTFVDGWVRTGEIARIDNEGYLILEGRCDDMIKVGGFSVFPEEIERVLTAHPSVSEVACVGYSDSSKIFGQIVCAYVVLRVAQEAGAIDALAWISELSDWAAAQLEPYKIPVLFKFVREIPKSASGKILRSILRKDSVDRS